MPNHHFLIKLLGVCVLASGAAMALFVGESGISNLMIAGGCLMYLAVKIGEWWDRK